MDILEFMLVLAGLSSVIGSMFSAIFGSAEAFWGTQLFAVLMAVLGGVFYYYF